MKPQKHLLHDSITWNLDYYKLGQIYHQVSNNATNTDKSDIFSSIVNHFPSFFQESFIINKY